MIKQWDILGIGAVAVDDLIYMENYPQPDSKTRVLSRRREGGGLTATALVCAARLGAKTAYYGILGDDELSIYTIKELEKAGVDCSRILYNNKAQPFQAIIMVVSNTGQRTVLSYPHEVVAVQPDDVSAELISSCRMLFIDHTVVQAGLKAVELAHHYNIPIIADLEAERDPQVYDLIPQIDHLILGIDFARQVTGESHPEKMVQALANEDRAACVVTAGDQGCWYSEYNSQVWHFPAFKVQAVDTTGCGDVFHGAYSYCVIRGDTIHKAIQYASAAAAVKAQYPGGRTGIPDLMTLELFLYQ